MSLFLRLHHGEVTLRFYFHINLADDPMSLIGPDFFNHMIVGSFFPQTAPLVWFPIHLFPHISNILSALCQVRTVLSLGNPKMSHTNVRWTPFIYKTSIGYFFNARLDLLPNNIYIYIISSTNRWNNNWDKLGANHTYNKVTKVNIFKQKIYATSCTIYQPIRLRECIQNSVEYILMLCLSHVMSFLL